MKFTVLFRRSPTHDWQRMLETQTEQVAKAAGERLVWEAHRHGDVHAAYTVMTEAR